MNRAFTYFLLLCVFPVGALFAAQPAAEPVSYIADLQVHTADELYGALKRADKLLIDNKFDFGKNSPVVFLLHGEEGKALLSANYTENQPLVDLAARLSALGVVDIKICLQWMGSQQIAAEQLLPFVGTVESWDEEFERLTKKEQYIYF